MASATDDASNPLRPGVIHASEFSSSSIPPGTHLFFDDDLKYINPVQERMNQRVLPVACACVYCEPPTSVVLHEHESNQAVKIKSPNKFREMKELGTPRGDFQDFLGEYIPDKIGTSFTPALISQLILFEQSSDRDPRRLYFFDFDRTLTFVPGLSFAFLPKKSKTRSVPTTDIPDSERVLLSQYARFLFSDYCGEEPAEGSGGRMRLLCELFSVIGNERIYIVTANSSAKKDNPYYLYFKYLISQLLPDFLEDHIIGVHSTNDPPLFRNKQDAIASILERSPRSPRSQRSPRSPSKSASASASPRKHGHGGRRVSRKPYHRRYSRSRSHFSLRRSTRKRRN